MNPSFSLELLFYCLYPVIACSLRFFPGGLDRGHFFFKYQRPLQILFELWFPLSSKPTLQLWPPYLVGRILDYISLFRRNFFLLHHLERPISFRPVIAFLLHSTPRSSSATSLLAAVSRLHSLILPWFHKADTPSHLPDPFFAASVILRQVNSLPADRLAVGGNAVFFF